MSERDTVVLRAIQGEVYAMPPAERALVEHHAQSVRDWIAAAPNDQEKGARLIALVLVGAELAAEG